MNEKVNEIEVKITIANGPILYSNFPTRGEAYEFIEWWNAEYRDCLAELAD